MIWEEVPAGRALAGFVAGDHACCEYGEDDSHDEIVTRVARGSLERDERLMVLTHHANAERILRRVAAAGIEAEEWHATGRLEIASADDLYSAGEFDADHQISAFEGEKRRARSDGYNGLAVTAEMSWMVDAPTDWCAILDYERRVTRIFDAGLRGLCLYDRRAFPKELMAEALSTHDFEIGVRPATLTARHCSMTLTEQDGRVGVHLMGEIDYASGHYLTARLAEHVDGESDLIVEAGELSFLGAGGARALIDAANLLPPPRHLVLRGAAQPVLRVIELCGFLDHPRLAIEPIAPA
ncbi:MAG TPA: MEDS domain-containing protein [Solirubrobacteraceae bacterium]